MNINITSSAINRIKELIQNHPDKNYNGLRIAVDGGGCSGFMYQYILESNSNSSDFVKDNEGIKIYIDDISQEFLDGCTIEFIEELGSSFFKISNPNASAKCGCGNSFAV